MKILVFDKLRERVDELLFDDQSPESVAERITGQEKELPPISSDSIGRYIKSAYEKNIEPSQPAEKKRQRGGRKGKLKDRKFIEEHPASLKNRARSVTPKAISFFREGRAKAFCL